MYRDEQHSEAAHVFNQLLQLIPSGQVPPDQALSGHTIHSGPLSVTRSRFPFPFDRLTAHRRCPRLRFGYLSCVARWRKYDFHSALASFLLMTVATTS